MGGLDKTVNMWDIAPPMQAAVFWKAELDASYVHIAPYLPAAAALSLASQYRSSTLAHCATVEDSLRIS